MRIALEQVAREPRPTPTPCRRSKPVAVRHEVPVLCVVKPLPQTVMYSRSALKNPD